MKARNREEATDSSVRGAVYVIDGDPGIRNSLRVLLETLSVQVLTFPCAEDFLNHTMAEPVTILITELDLPGMSGFELKRTLNRLGSRIPVIGLSSNTDQGERREASRLGFLEVVEKPFVYQSVIERVQKTLGAP